MSYTFQSTLFDSPITAARSAVEEYLTAGGMNDTETVCESLLTTSASDLADEMVENDFIPQPMPLADDIDTEEWHGLFTQALKEMRSRIDTNRLIQDVSDKAGRPVFEDSYGSGVALVENNSYPDYLALAQAYGLDITDYYGEAS